MASGAFITVSIKQELRASFGRWHNYRVSFYVHNYLVERFYWISERPLG